MKQSGYVHSNLESGTYYYSVASVRNELVSDLSDSVSFTLDEGDEAVSIEVELEVSNGKDYPEELWDFYGPDGNVVIAGLHFKDTGGSLYAPEDLFDTAVWSLDSLRSTFNMESYKWKNNTNVYGYKAASRNYDFQENLKIGVVYMFDRLSFDMDNYLIEYGGGEVTLNIKVNNQLSTYSKWLPYPGAVWIFGEINVQTGELIIIDSLDVPESPRGHYNERIF